MKASATSATLSRRSRRQKSASGERAAISPVAVAASSVIVPPVSWSSSAAPVLTAYGLASSAYLADGSLSQVRPGLIPARRDSTPVGVDTADGPLCRFAPRWPSPPIPRGQVAHCRPGA